MGCIFLQGIPSSSSMGCSVDIICSTTVLSIGSGKYILHHGISMACKGISAQVSGAPPPPPYSLPLVFVGLFLTLFFTHFFLSHTAAQHFYPLLTMFFTVAPPALLIELALACGGSVAELAGTICVQLHAASGFFAQRPPLQHTPPPPKTLPCTPNTVRNFIASAAAS